MAGSRHRRVTALTFLINAQAAVANGDSSRAQKSQIRGSWEQQNQKQL
jgi:hypothetical protein